jgi:hypothetical protein
LAYQEFEHEPGGTEGSVQKVGFAARDLRSDFEDFGREDFGSWQHRWKKHLV